MNKTGVGEGAKCSESTKKAQWLRGPELPRTLPQILGKY